MWYDKFKVNQRVRVAKKIENWSYEEDEVVRWMRIMDTTLNNIYKIIAIDGYGYRLDTRIGKYEENFYYPVESLRRVAGEQLVFDFMR